MWRFLKCGVPQRRSVRCKSIHIYGGLCLRAAHIVQRTLVRRQVFSTKIVSQHETSNPARNKSSSTSLITRVGSYNGIVYNQRGDVDSQIPLLSCLYWNIFGLRNQNCVTSSRPGLLRTPLLGGALRKQNPFAQHSDQTPTAS